MNLGTFVWSHFSPRRNLFEVVEKGVDRKFLFETLKRPWMRLKIFLSDDELSGTPEHYKKFIYEWMHLEPTPVHYIPDKRNWKIDEIGNVVRVRNVPIPLKYPLEVHQTLWGGDAVVRGLLMKGKVFEAPVPRYWVPKLHETVIYSEILDKYIKVIVTNRALDMIDEHYGLDNYLMETKPADLMSELALKMKRELLFALQDKSQMYPNDESKREEMFDKYKKYIIPPDELDWYGLSLREAARKQLKIDETDRFVGPYKHIFREEIIEKLRNTKGEDLEKTDITGNWNLQVKNTA